MQKKVILSLSQVQISYKKDGVQKVAVNNFSAEIHHGESVAIVGESGSGKTTIANAILQLLPKNAMISGSIKFEDKELLTCDLREIRGKKIAMIFQNPMSSLTPHLTIKHQMLEQIKQHLPLLSKKEMLDKAEKLLAELKIENPQYCLTQYPFQLSGGMQQRVMIAMALSCDPEILIADEPTTALDVTIQSQILNDIANLIHQRNLSLVMISHDLAVVSQLCEKIIIMRYGEIVEVQDNLNFARNAEHDYTKQLIAALTHQNKVSTELSNNDKIIDVENLRVVYRLRNKEKLALRNISFNVKRGEFIGIAGESGSGKSTVLKVLSKFVMPEKESKVLIEKEEVGNIKEGVLYNNLQLIFQDPFSALNPRRTIFQSIAEPLQNFEKLSRKALKDMVAETMQKCELSEALANRYPHELSGGECQRAVIARAISINPQILLCDEPISALDVLIQKQIISLLLKLQKELKLTIVFVSHDLSVMEKICDRIIIMQNGEIVEENFPKELFSNPQHDYTKRLIASIPQLKI